MASLCILRLLWLREQADAAASLRQAKAEPISALSLVPQSQQSQHSALAPVQENSVLSAGIDELVAALKPRPGSAEGLASEDSSILGAGKAHVDTSCLHLSQARVSQTFSQDTLSC